MFHVARQATSAPTGGTVVLDTTSTWRMYHVLRGPLMQADGNLRAVPHYDDRGKLDWADGIRKPYREVIAPETAAAPANWKAADFEDGDWLRGTAVRAIRSPYLERLCLRGKFTVTDPAKVKGLTISVDYHGGAVVYVNGREIAREHLAAGAAMAEEYPLEAFVAPNGKLIGVRGDEALQRTKIPPDVLKRIQGRVRKLSAAVPAKAIQAGLNLVAVELVRTPYHKVVDEQMAILDNHNRSKIEDLSWNTCEIKRVQLTAAGADGLVPGASRTAGFELWNSNPLAIDYDLDQGEAGPLYPIRLAAAATAHIPARWFSAATSRFAAWPQWPATSRAKVGASPPPMFRSATPCPGATSSSPARRATRLCRTPPSPRRSWNSVRPRPKRFPSIARPSTIAASKSPDPECRVPRRRRSSARSSRSG